MAEQRRAEEGAVGNRWRVLGMERRVAGDATRACTIAVHRNVCARGACGGYVTGGRTAGVCRGAGRVLPLRPAAGGGAVAVVAAVIRANGALYRDWRWWTQSIFGRRVVVLCGRTMRSHMQWNTMESETRAGCLACVVERVGRWCRGSLRHGRNGDRLAVKS